MVSDKEVVKNKYKKNGNEDNRMAAFRAEYSGPLPPSSEFRRYEEVLPGAADRILSMAEKSLDAEIRDNGRYRVTVFVSMLFNKIIIYVLIILAFVLLLLGKNIEAFCAALLPLIQVLSTIVESGSKKK